MTSSNTYQTDYPYTHHYNTLPSELVNRVRQEAINQERNRIARELHDSIMQQIIHVLYKLEYSQHLLAMNNQQSVSFELQYVRDTLNGSLHKLRNTVSGLFAGQVERQSLFEMIQQLVNEYKRILPEVEVILKITGLEESPDLPPKLVSVISKCIQEALTNIWKHAHATSISIQLSRSDSWLVVEVSDNGIGFQPEQVLMASKHHTGEESHFGLAIMCERIEETGGSWELYSRPDEGTIVKACFPLANLTTNEQTEREYEIIL